MTKQQAIEIINKNRISNPFTMGLELEEYILNFRKRYALICNIILPNDVIEVAKAMQK